MKRSNKPLSELLRPQALQDLTLPDREIECLQRMLDKQAPMNMLFYGPPGLGKTSAARIFTKARGEFGIYEVNGSLKTGIDNVRTMIDVFCSVMALDGEGHKICFIDEADFLSLPAQGSLRGLIEAVSSSCRFIMTANDITKISGAIRSRLICISFEVNRADQPAIIARMQTRMAERLGVLGISFDTPRLNQIVANYFPDFRQIVNRLEYEFCCQPEYDLAASGN
jgi:replication-associated recombination protein RarA